MATRLYQWSSDEDQYVLDATLHTDGSVTGTSPASNKLRLAVEYIEEAGEDPADWYENLRDRLVAHWDNGMYRVEWDG